MNGLLMFEFQVREWLTITWSVLWQSTVICAFVWVAAWVLRNATPQTRYWLWMALAVKLLLMPLWFIGADPLPSSWLANPVQTSRPGSGMLQAPVSLQSRGPNPNSADRRSVAELLEEIGLGTAAADESRVAKDHFATTNISESSRSSPVWPVASALAGVWLGVVLARAAVLWRQHRRMQRIVVSSAPVGRDWMIVAENAAKTLGLRTTPVLRVTSADVSPFVWGFSRPSIILPGWMLTDLSTSALRSVLLHEFAHVRRRDPMWVWLPEVVKLLYWFHPVAHLVAARVRLERELSCDQLVLAHTNFDAAGYAETLLNVLSRLSCPAVCRVPVTLLGLHSGAFWTRRITMLENSGMKKLLPSRGVTFSLLIGCCLGLAIPTFVPRWLEARGKKPAPHLAASVNRPPVVVTTASHSPQDHFASDPASMGRPTPIVAESPGGGIGEYAGTAASGLPTAFDADISFGPGAAAPGGSTALPNQSAAAGISGPGMSQTSATKKPSDELLEFLPLPSEGEQHIARELEKPTEVAFTDTPLIDATTFLADYHNIPIILDDTALNERSLPHDAPITRTLSGVKLRSALKIILNPLGLTAVIQNEVLKITSMAQSEVTLFTRTYPVADLCYSDSDYTNLVSAIQRSSRMKNWDAEAGGEATIVPVERASSLIVTQNYEGHEHVLDLLRMLREVKSHPRRPQAPRRSDPMMGTGMPGMGGMGMGGTMPMSGGSPFGQ